MRSPSSFHLLTLVLALGACGKGAETRFGRMPNDRGRAAVGPALDAGIAFDFRWARIEPTAHVGQTRQCDVVALGARESVPRRTERRYGDREVVERLSVRCAAGPHGSTWLDVLFPPAALGFAARVRQGDRLLVEVVAPSGGFDGATVGEFRAVAEPLDASVPLIEPDPISIPAAFDFRQVEHHPELVGSRQPCSVAWVGAIDRIAEEQRMRFPVGATHRVSIACEHARGDSRVDVVATPRSAPDLLSLRRGIRVELRILAARGGAADEPIARLER